MPTPFRLVLLVCLTLAPSLAHAQDDTSGYANLVAQAVEAYNAEQWAAAQTLFERAHELEPSARTLRGIGLAAYRRGLYAEAVRRLDAAVRDERRPLDDSQRAEIATVLTDAREHIAAARVGPSGASTSNVERARSAFTRGQRAFDSGAYDEALAAFRESYGLARAPELLFNIGQAADHLRRDREAREAFEAYLREVPTAPDRAAIEARIRLLAEHERAADAPSSERAREPAGLGLAPWMVGGVGIAVSTTGAVLLAVGLSSQAAVQDAPDGSRWADVAADHDRAGPFTTAGAVLLAVGLVGVGVSATLLVVGGRDSNERRATVAVGPASAWVVGRF